MKRALILGINGQDGAYLAKHLLSLGYEVYGGARQSSSGGAWRLDRLGIRERVIPLSVDVLDEWSVARAIDAARPDEIYNLAAQGHVGVSWTVPTYTLAANSLGALNVILHMGDARLFQASTLDIFGDQPCPDLGFDEATPVKPFTPYGISKAAAHHFAHAHRRKGRFIACGIMGNHESPLRQDTFVTQKIAKGVKRWKETGEPFELHNVTGIRDWGWAPEYIQAMHLMLQQDEPDDYVLATGERASVLDFLQAAVGSRLDWTGGFGKEHLQSGDDLVCHVRDGASGLNVKSPVVVGNPAKAKDKLGWVPQVRRAEIARKMVEAA